MHFSSVHVPTNWHLTSCLNCSYLHALAWSYLLKAILLLFALRIQVTFHGKRALATNLTFQGKSMLFVLIQNRLLFLILRIRERCTHFCLSPPPICNRLQLTLHRKWRMMSKVKDPKSTPPVQERKKPVSLEQNMKKEEASLLPPHHAAA